MVKVKGGKLVNCVLTFFPTFNFSVIKQLCWLFWGLVSLLHCVSLCG